MITLDPHPEPRKSLGQHFLSDQSYCRRIVALAQASDDDLIVEIGPGTGALTSLLLDSGAKVLAIEVDPRMIGHLVLRFGHSLQQQRLTLLEQDVLAIDWTSLLDTALHVFNRWEAGTVKLVANLPYNIATHILSSTTSAANRFHSLTVMTQKEVARRVTAAPGSKDYGYLSVLMGYHYRPGPGFDVPPGAFSPPPKVDSRVFQLYPGLPPPDPPDYGVFLNVVSRGFAHRRKKLWNNLAGSGFSETRLEAAFRGAGLPRAVRAEAVPLAGFIALARVLSCAV